MTCPPLQHTLHHLRQSWPCSSLTSFTIDQHHVLSRQRPAAAAMSARLGQNVTPKPPADATPTGGVAHGGLDKPSPLGRPTPSANGPQPAPGLQKAGPQPPPTLSGPRQALRAFSGRVGHPSTGPRQPLGTSTERHRAGAGQAPLIVPGPRQALGAPQTHAQGGGLTNQSQTAGVMAGGAPAALTGKASDIGACVARNGFGGEKSAVVQWWLAGAPSPRGPEAFPTSPNS
jgi:hypothetical protein